MSINGAALSGTPAIRDKAAIVGMDWQQIRMIPRFVPTSGGLFVLEVDGGPSRDR